jgi:hypothetical protein
MNTHSAEADPRVPAEKLSTKRTVLYSKGTIVPPDYFRKVFLKFHFKLNSTNISYRNQNYFFL